MLEIMRAQKLGSPNGKHSLVDITAFSFEKECR